MLHIGPFGDGVDESIGGTPAPPAPSATTAAAAAITTVTAGTAPAAVAADDSDLNEALYSRIGLLEIKPLVSQHEMRVFKRMCLVIEPNPRRLKRVMQTYTLISEVAKRRAVDEGQPDVMVGKLPQWRAFTSKLVKWTCLCELYPYRMSLLVLTVTDFEQKQTVNRLAHKRNSRSTLQREPLRWPSSTKQLAKQLEVRQYFRRWVCSSRRLSRRRPFFHYVPTQMPDVAGAAAPSGGEAEAEFAPEDESIATFYNRHVERFLYSLGLSQKMLQLDGDAELFQTLLMLPVPSGDPNSAEDDTVDICIADILGPKVYMDRDSEQSPDDEQTANEKPIEQFGIYKREANLSLLTYSFNLNPALRHQLSCETAALQTEWELGDGKARAIQATGVMQKQRMVEELVRQQFPTQLGLDRTRAPTPLTQPPPQQPRQPWYRWVQMG